MGRRLEPWAVRPVWRVVVPFLLVEAPGRVELLGDDVFVKPVHRPVRLLPRPTLFEVAVTRPRVLYVRQGVVDRLDKPVSRVAHEKGRPDAESLLPEAFVV